MNLAIFDLDGTLTDSNDVDTECFLAAWRNAHGLECSGLSFPSFENITDRGIADALCELHFGPERRASGYESVKAQFLSLLASTLRERPESCRPVAGAVEILRILASHNWGVVVATGAWSESARMKLAAAGFPASIPLASSDQCASRSDIVRSAIEIAEREYGGHFDRRVLVGDAPWDLATAAELNLPFVGVAVRGDAERLLTIGAAAVLHDFTDSVAVEHALMAASVPRYPTDSE
jgi:phosphoglycolate phosphatase-like HAD superfamily hydrolase